MCVMSIQRAVAIAACFQNVMYVFYIKIALRAHIHKATKLFHFHVSFDFFFFSSFSLFFFVSIQVFIFHSKSTSIIMHYAPWLSEKCVFHIMNLHKSPQWMQYHAAYAKIQFKWHHDFGQIVKFFLHSCYSFVLFLLFEILIRILLFFFCLQNMRKCLSKFFSGCASYNKTW